jgi:hypothetical protein
MWVLIPQNPYEPVLVGASMREGDIDEPLYPPGYRRVQFVGTPQETARWGRTTNHAEDSVEAGLALARMYGARTVMFNSAISTSTRGVVQSPLRPDVMVELAPDSGLGPKFRFIPYESLSPGQDLETRSRQLSLHPSIAPARGQHYRKLLLLLWNRFSRRLRAEFFFRS